MSGDPRKKRNLEWMIKHVREHPDDSVQECARAAYSAGVKLTHDQAADYRRIARARLATKTHDASLADEEQEEGASIEEAPLPFCQRCRTVGHWPSDCTTIIEPAAPEPQPEEPSMRMPTPPPEAITPRTQTPDRPAIEEQIAKLEADQEGRRQTEAGTALRRRWLNLKLELDPTPHPSTFLARMREVFGVALGNDYVYDTCRVARDLNGISQIPYRIDTDARLTSGATSAENRLIEIAKLLKDACAAHNLSAAQLEFAAGKVRWRYEISVEKEGEIS